MLEEVTRWDNKQLLMQAVYSACDKMNIAEAKFICDCLIKGMDFVNSNIRKNKKLVSWFLSEVYPMENMNRKSETELASYMSELIEAGKMLKVDW